MLKLHFLLRQHTVRTINNVRTFIIETTDKIAIFEDAYTKWLYPIIKHFIVHLLPNPANKIQSLRRNEMEIQIHFRIEKRCPSPANIKICD